MTAVAGITTTIQGLDAATLATSGALFVLVLTLWVMGVLVWGRRRSSRRAELRTRLTDRRQGERQESRVLRLWHEGEEITTTVSGEAYQPSLRARLDQVRRSSAWEASLAATTLGLAIAAIGAGIGVYLLSSRITSGIFAAVLVVGGFWWYLTLRATRRASVFERQLIDGLELSARALEAGHPLLNSFQLIAEEIPDPVGRIFADICQEQAMGVRLEDSVRRQANQSQSTDLRLFAASLTINLRSGGNLSEVVQGLANVVRDRMSLNRRFRVLISQTQYSKRILIGLPIVMFGVLNVINPEYMSFFYRTTPGHLLLLSAAGMLTLGWWVMNKMAILKH